MTSYLPQSRISETGHILYSSSAYGAVTHTKGGRIVQDSIQYGKENGKDAVLNNPSSGRVALPAPTPSSSPAEMMILAEAFVRAFSAMNNGVITQNQDYVQLQQLDQTQTNAVLESTTNAINKQQAAETLAAQVSAYDQQMSQTETIFGWVTFGLGIALMIGTFVSGFFTGGTTDAALPEEVEMLNMAENAGEDLAETASEDVDAVESSSEEPAPTESANLDESASENSNQLDETESETKKTLTRDLDESNTEDANSSKFSSRGKFLLKMGFAAGFASPMLMTGITKLEVSDQLYQLSQSQSDVGNALDTLQQNNMYFQFLQQLIQREGGVMQDEVKNASEVVDTFASITSAYRGISYGLANAV